MPAAPAQAGRIRLSPEDVVRQAYGQGLTDPNKLITALAVAQAESGFMQDVISTSGDYGLWQINWSAHHTQYDFPRLITDPAYNAKAMMDISGQGSNFTQWATYSPDLSQAKAGTGPYKNFLNAAVATVNKVLSTQVQLPTNPVSNPTNPADVTAQVPAGIYNAPVVNIDPNERQLAFDSRHRRVGTRSRLMDIFAGPTYTGVMYPVLPNGPTSGQNVPYGSQSGARGEGGRGVGFEGMGSNVVGGIQAVFFEFNPNEISFDYSANPNVLPIGALDPSQTNTNLPMPDSNTVISFDLYFDRTYEVMDGGSDTIGVLTDIRALEHLCGISDAEPVMRQNPVAIHFGTPVQFHFKALVKSFGVKYQHFSHAMVPMRAVVSISATRLSNVDPWASPEAVKTYTGDDWKDKVIESNKGGQNNAWESAAGATPRPEASPASNSNNPWVSAVGGGQ